MQKVLINLRNCAILIMFVYKKTKFKLGATLMKILRNQNERKATKSELFSLRFDMSKGLSIKPKITSSLGSKIKRVTGAAALGVLALSSLVSCGSNQNNNSEPEVTEPTEAPVIDETDDYSTITQSMLSIKDTWEEKFELAKEQVVAAQADIAFTTKEVIQFYKDYPEADSSRKDEYLKVLKDFEDLCTTILEQAEKKDSKGAKETAKLVKDLLQTISENINEVEEIQTVDSEVQASFEIPSTIKVGEVMNVVCNDAKLSWNDLYIELSDDKAFQFENSSQNRLKAWTEGEVIVSIKNQITGETLYTVPVTILPADAVVTTTPVLDPNTVITKKSSDSNSNSSNNSNSNSNTNSSNNNSSNNGGNVVNPPSNNSNSGNINNNNKPSVTTKATAAPKPVTTKKTEVQKPVTTKATPKPTPVPTPDPTPTPPPVTEAPTPEPPPVVAWYPGQGMSMYDVEPGWDGQLKWGCRTEEQMAFTVYCMKEALNRSDLDSALREALADLEWNGGFEYHAANGTSAYTILYDLRNNCSKVDPATVAHEICNQHGVNFNDYYSNEGNAYYALLGGCDCDGASYYGCLKNYYYWGYTTEFLGFADAEHAESRVKLAEGLWSISDEGCTERHTYEGNYYRDQHDLDMLKPYFDKYGIAY